MKPAAVPSLKEEIELMIGVAFTVKFMEAGGCLKKFYSATVLCEDAAAKSGHVKRCIEAMVALRRCMMANEAFFKHYIGDLDRGLDDNERHGYGIKSKAVSDGFPLLKFRWWSNMRRK
ncbi:hypothetical protein QOZ80_5BG0443210 [Eleusine coracana subsp. coracana]|nr:hypothetical protein QOZ80_5BG0443210 [Eleusine coracana subsp. coracana]